MATPRPGTEVTPLQRAEAICSPPLYALVAVDLKGWPALVRAEPKDWWDRMLMGDNFVDIFDTKTPKKPGVYSWQGHYRSNRTGLAMPNGEIDYWPGEWWGSWAKEM